MRVRGNNSTSRLVRVSSTTFELHAVRVQFSLVVV